jgi:hypothetical protein
MTLLAKDDRAPLAAGLGGALLFSELINKQLRVRRALADNPARLRPRFWRGLNGGLEQRGRRVPWLGVGGEDELDVPPGLSSRRQMRQTSDTMDVVKTQGDFVSIGETGE